MARIINLSSCHTFHSIYSPYGIGAFAELRRKYKRDCCQFPLDFTKPIRNWAAVVYDYKWHEATIIEPYKRGQRTTVQFFDAMLNIFDFLKEPENDGNSYTSLLGENRLAFLQEDIDLVNRNRNFLLAVKNKQGLLSHNDYAKALLEMAWTARIECTEEDISRCENLFETANEDEPIYIVSNTNVLDVHKFIALLMAKANIRLNESVDLELLPDIDKDIEQDFIEKPFEEKLIQLAPGIYLCLSYKVGLYKTMERSQKHIADHSTSSLIRALVRHIGTPQEIQVISRWKPDLEEAQKEGVPQPNCYAHEDYFRAQQKSLLRGTV